MQIDNVFTAYFLDTATAPWAPLTGLSATITIVDVSDNSTAVNNVAMTEIWLGFYKYVFAGYSSSKDYVYSCNPNSLLAYIQSWVTDKRLDNLDKSISEITAKWGGSIQLGWIDSKLAKVIEKLSEEKEIIDFTPILNKIDSIEIPKQKEVKLEEKEAKKALKAIQILDKKQNIILEYIDKDKSEKEELGMLSREFTRVEMEHEEKKMKHEEEMRQKEIEDKKREEEEKKMEEENDKKLLEEIKSEFAKLEEEDKVEKKKELEMELKEMEKEMKEKEKELKKL
mgnify:CR=1 FL=1